MYLINQIFKEIVRKSKGKKTQRRRRRTEEEDMISVHEELVANILTKLPLGSIIRFKLVCKAWRSLIESDFFRHLLHKGNANSTSPYWSILHTDICLYDSRMDDELELNFPHESHGNNWSFKSMRHHHHMDVDDRSKIRVVSCADGLVLLRHESSNESIRYYIGNPVLSQWTLLPPPPILPRGDRYYDSGLVTRMHNGVILGYKVVRLHKNIQRTDNPNPRTLSFEMYSSDTGEWSYKQVSCPGDNPELVIQYNPITLNGKLYWHAEGMDDGIVVYDFFSDDDDQATSIRLPDRMQRFHPDHSDASRCFDFCMCPCYKMICSTSQGFFVFIEAGRMTGKEEGYNVKVWRLMIKSDDHSWEWETAWEINMASIGIGFESVPMAINNFDVDIIYLWSLQHRRYVAYNVRTQTKYLGPSNRDGPAANEMHLPCDISACFYPRNTLTQFVLSLQEVPKMFSKCS